MRLPHATVTVGPRTQLGVFRDRVGQAVEVRPRPWAEGRYPAQGAVLNVRNSTVTPPPDEAGGFSLGRVGLATDQPGP
ncbi:hypothetical protein GCM10010442_46830 [Kitasatospora kifunensis]